MEPLDDQATNNQGLTPIAKNALFNTRSWMMFIAIISLVFIGILLIPTIGGILNGEILGALIMLAVIALMAYPFYILLRSAKNIKQFQLDGSPTTFEAALKDYKNYWAIWGVVLAIFLAFAVLAFIIGMLGFLT